MTFLAFQAPIRRKLGIVAGRTTQVQYNNAGAFAGDANFTYDSATGKITAVRFATNGIGSASVPAFSFPSAGLYSRDSYVVNISCVNTNVAEFGGLGIGIKPGLPLGWGATTSKSDALDTAFSRISAGLVGLGTGAAASYAADLKLRNLIGTGNLATGIAAKTSDYTATANDGSIEVVATSGAITITLPAASDAAGRIYVVKKTDSSGNAVTIDANASETIDGATTVSLASQYSTAIIQCNAAGTAWLRLATI